MIEKQRLLVEDLVRLMKKHSYDAFVGTFFAAVRGSHTNYTVRLVAPFLDEKKFIALEDSIAGSVDAIFKTISSPKETGKMIDPDSLEQ